jgi:phosphoenolpyruvate synthase/pyruvate phosphate dikinase
MRITIHLSEPYNIYDEDGNTIISTGNRRLTITKQNKPKSERRMTFKDRDYNTKEEINSLISRQLEDFLEDPRSCFGFSCKTYD